MRGGEGLPHESDSYQGDTRTHGQEEAPPQKASNSVCPPLIKKYKESKNSCRKKFSELLFNFNDFILVMQM